MSALQMRSTKKYLCLLSTNRRRITRPTDLGNSEIKLYGIATGNGLAKVGTMLSSFECEYRKRAWYIANEPVFYVFFIDQGEIRILEK